MNEKARDIKAVIFASLLLVMASSVYAEKTETVDLGPQDVIQGAAVGNPFRTEGAAEKEDKGEAGGTTGTAVKQSGPLAGEEVESGAVKIDIKRAKPGKIVQGSREEGKQKSGKGNTPSTAVPDVAKNQRGGEQDASEDGAGSSGPVNTKESRILRDTKPNKGQARGKSPANPKRVRLVDTASQAEGTDTVSAKKGRVIQGTRKVDKKDNRPGKSPATAIPGRVGKGNPPENGIANGEGDGATDAGLAEEETEGQPDANQQNPHKQGRIIRGTHAKDEDGSARRRGDSLQNAIPGRLVPRSDGKEKTKPEQGQEKGTQD